MSKKVFGGAIAVILLGLYSWLVTYAVLVTRGATDGFTLQMGTAMTTIGGLISALVIAELAITVPGQPPAARLFAAGGATGSQEQHSLVAQIVTTIYLVVWIATGVAAFVAGDLLQHANDIKALADLGQSWFGIAVAAAYAYLGIEPAKQ